MTVECIFTTVRLGAGYDTMQNLKGSTADLNAEFSIS